MIFLVSWVCEWWIFVLNITPFTSYLFCFHLCGSVFGIRIHKIPEYGSNLDPDPKHCLCLTILPHPPGTWRPTPRWTISSPTPPTGKSMKSYAAPRWTISSPTPPTSTVWYSAILRSQSVFGQLRILMYTDSKNRFSRFLPFERVVVKTPAMLYFLFLAVFLLMFHIHV